MMVKIKKTLSAVAIWLLRIILYTLFAPAFFVAKLCESIDQILDDVEDKMGLK